MERAKLKGFQFDKTLSANFSSEQLTEINSLVSLSPPPFSFFPRFFFDPVYFDPTPPSESKFTFHRSLDGRILLDSFRFSSTDSRRVARRIGQPTPFSRSGGPSSKAERCKFAEFPGISSRLNAFNGSPVGRERSRVINNLRSLFGIAPSCRWLKTDSCNLYYCLRIDKRDDIKRFIAFLESVVIFVNNKMNWFKIKRKVSCNCDTK